MAKMFRNLLDETIESMFINGKTAKDVRFVTDCTTICCWNTFVELASGYDYDGGYGHAYVNQHLMIVGDDWWLERLEYDGSEGWEFKTIPKQDGFVYGPVDIKAYGADW